MKSTLITAAASAAPMVMASHVPSTNDPTNGTAISYMFPPLVARYTGECEPLCEKYRSRNDCVSAGYQNNCFDACLSACFAINDGAGTDSPSESDLIIIMSEDSEWNPMDSGKHYNTSGDERTEVPCWGWCKREEGSEPNEAEVNVQVRNMLDRVTAYGQIYHHLKSMEKTGDGDGDERALVPVGTRLDPYLKTWVAGFKDRLVEGRDLAEWHNSLFKLVEQTEDPVGGAWAYRFELVAHKDSEKELGELVHGLDPEQRRAIVKTAHKLWREEFGEVLKE